MNQRTPPIPFQYAYGYMYTQSDKTIVRKDWAALLPDMTPTKKGRPKYPFFQRRIGPLLIRLGYIFSRGGTNYQTSCSLLNLAYECNERNEDFFDSKTLVYPDALYSSVSPYEHKKKYIQVFENLNSKARTPLNGPVTLDDIFNGYSKSIMDNGKLKNIRYFGAVGTPALVAAWAGELEKAMEYLEWACDRFYEDDEPLGTKAEFRKFHENLIQNPEILRIIADKNLQNGDSPSYWPELAPYQDIVGVRYQKLKK